MPRTAFATTLDYDSKKASSAIPSGAVLPGAVVARAGPFAPGPGPFPKDAECANHYRTPAEILYVNCAGRPVYVCVPCFMERVRVHATCVQCWTPRQRQSFQEKYGGA